MKHRRDNNQQEIVDVFNKMGANVFYLAGVGCGLPVLLVGVNGFNLLVEVKSPKGKLTPDQNRFFLYWRGQSIVIRNTDEAINLMQKYRNLKPV